jgi:hypothetical protein
MMESLVALRERRDQVIARLSDCYASDVLDVDELDRRLDLAHAAATVAELDALIADLAPAAGAPTTALAPVGQRSVVDPNRSELKRMRVLLGTVERRSRWLVPIRLEVRVFWGNGLLDFRDASLGPGVTTLDVRVTMGNLELILPPWLPIDVDVSSLAANVGERHRTPFESEPNRPLLRVIGAVRFGNLEIATRLPGETERDARERERRERKEGRALASGRGEM